MPYSSGGGGGDGSKWHLMCWFVINALATFLLNVRSSAVSVLFAMKIKMITLPTFQAL
jgi:hypothetical protein